MDLYRESTRISKSVKADWELLIYIAWQLEGGYQPGNWREIWIDLFSCKSAGKRDKGNVQQR